MPPLLKRLLRKPLFWGCLATFAGCGTAVLASFAGLLLLADGCIDIERSTSPVDCYQFTFGKPPGPSVSGLRGDSRAFRDSGHCYLRFRVPEPDLMTLLGGRFRTITREQFIGEWTGFGPAPAWWAPLSGTPTIFMSSESFHPSFARGRAFLAYDAGTQIVHFYWDGID